MTANSLKTGVEQTSKILTFTIGEPGYLSQYRDGLRAGRPEFDSRQGQ
jgi:hypothetical protein